MKRTLYLRKYVYSMIKHIYYIYIIYIKLAILYIYILYINYFESFTLKSFDDDKYGLISRIIGNISQRKRLVDYYFHRGKIPSFHQPNCVWRCYRRLLQRRNDRSLPLQNRLMRVLTISSFVLLFNKQTKTNLLLFLNPDVSQLKQF